MGRNRYVIHLIAGPKIQPRDGISGIWPHRVFNTLEKYEVEHKKAIKYL